MLVAHSTTTPSSFSNPTLDEVQERVDALVPKVAEARSGLFSSTPPSASELHGFAMDAKNSANMLRQIPGEVASAARDFAYEAAYRLLEAALLVSPTPAANPIDVAVTLDMASSQLANARQILSDSNVSAR